MSRELSKHILPSSATMLGVCVTLIGLVRIVEARIGPSHVDEYAGLVSLFFLASALASYSSMRSVSRSRFAERPETFADLLVLAGLASISFVALLFAYEGI